MSSTLYVDKLVENTNGSGVDLGTNVKVGGNIIASHTGVEGSGEVTLQNATLDSGVVFPAGHVVQSKLTTVSQYTESNTSTSAIVPRGVTSFTATAGNMLHLNVYIPEITKGSASQGEYVGVFMFISQEQPDSTVNLNTYGGLFDDYVGVAIGYYGVANANYRVHGLSFMNGVIAPNTGTYYAWFGTRSSSTFTHSVGVNAPNKMVITEIVQ